MILLVCTHDGERPSPGTASSTSLGSHGPRSKFVQVHLNGIHSFYSVDCTTQIGVICKLPEGALDPIVYVIDKDIKYLSAVCVS